MNRNHIKNVLSRLLWLLQKLNMASRAKKVLRDRVEELSGGRTAAFVNEGYWTDLVRTCSSQYKGYLHTLLHSVRKIQILSDFCIRNSWTKSLKKFRKIWISRHLLTLFTNKLSAVNPFKKRAKFKTRVWNFCGLYQKLKSEENEGKSYIVYCEASFLYFIAGIHIRPKFHDHSCHEDLLEKLKHQLEKSMEDIKQDELRHVKVPRKCYSNIQTKFYGLCKIQLEIRVSHYWNSVALFQNPI